MDRFFKGVKLQCRSPDSMYATDAVTLAQVYTIYSILFIVFIILIIVTAFITVALTYFQLAVEDHRWWWRAVMCGGSTGKSPLCRRISSRTASCCFRSPLAVASARVFLQLQPAVAAEHISRVRCRFVYLRVHVLLLCGAERHERLHAGALPCPCR